MSVTSVSDQPPPATAAAQLSRADRDARASELLERLRSAREQSERESLRDQIVRLYRWMPRSFARRYGGQGEDVDDLEQAGYVGLVKAINRFDPARGAFTAYATATIAGEIKRHFRDHAWAVRPTRRLHDANRRGSRREGGASD